jgi:hypothetical protein
MVPEASLTFIIRTKTPRLVTIGEGACRDLLPRACNRGCLCGVACGALMGGPRPLSRSFRFREALHCWRAGLRKSLAALPSQVAEAAISMKDAWIIGTPRPGRPSPARIFPCQALRPTALREQRSALREQRASRRTKPVSRSSLLYSRRSGNWKRPSAFCPRRTSPCGMKHSRGGVVGI